MSDSITEVTHQSWFSRIGGAIKGVVVGFILLAVAFVLLFWNEGRSVKRYKTLKEGSGAVVSVEAGKVDKANAGKLVHLTAKADTKQTLTDDLFGVSARALKLKRIVEMYQWTETSHKESKKNLGGSKTQKTTYSYSKKWSEDVIKSADFHESEGHKNPGSKAYRSLTQTAEPITLGAFVLSPSLVDKIDHFEPLPIESDATLPEAIKEKVKISDGGFYVGKDTAKPEVGDTRIKFEVAKPATITVVAAQVKQTFEPYKTNAGGEIELLKEGTFSAKAMFDEAQKDNRNLTWILRLVGFVLMLIGLNLMLRPLSVVADVVPIFGTIVGMGTGFLSFLFAAALSLVTIAIAWILCRPLIGILLLVLAVGLIAALLFLRRAKTAA